MGWVHLSVDFPSMLYHENEDLSSPIRCVSGYFLEAPKLVECLRQAMLCWVSFGSPSAPEVAESHEFFRLTPEVPKLSGWFQSRQ